MATIDELFETMAAEDTGPEYLVIDPVTRQIFVPENQEIFGVEADTNSARKYFQAPRYVGDNLDLAACFLSVIYRNANGEKDEYLVEDVTVTGDSVTFSWLLSSKVVAYMGQVQFRVYADNGAGKDWGTTLATGTSLEGLMPEEVAVEEETSDVVTQLRAMVAAQTAAVANEGAAQVQAVGAAGSAATAAAEAQIEAKGTATLATIPADYTALAGKANEQANAIKGRLAGEIVRADDVSPVEHYPVVRVHGKNLLVPNHASYTSSGYTITLNDDGSVTITGAATTTASIYLSLALRTGASNNTRIKLAAGHRYIMSAYKDGEAKAVNVRTVYADGTTTWQPTKKWHQTDDATQDREIAQVYLESTGHEVGDASLCGTYCVQLEEGDTATEYTPYVAPEAMTLTRCGKNLLEYSGTKSQNGVTLTLNEDGSYTVGGTVTGTVNLNIGYAYLKAGRKYRPTIYLAAGTVVPAFWNYTTGANMYKDGDGLLVSDQDARLSVYIYEDKVGTEIGATFNVMLELAEGETSTAFEPYTGETYTPAADGSVGGLTSLAPTMSLHTDTAGAVVECEYNRDTNAVYAEILEKIAALGG